MAEAQIGAGKPGIAGLHKRHTHSAVFIDHVAGEYFFCQRHGPLAGANGRQKNLLLRAGHVEWKQAAVFDDLARDLVFALGEFAEQDLGAGADFIDQKKVSRSKHAQVLAILLVDTFDIFRDHELDAGAHLRIGRLLAAGAFAAPLAAHRSHKSTALDIAPAYGNFGTALQSQIGNLTQGLVEVKTILRRRDLVGGNVVAQFRIVGRVARVPGQVPAGKLLFDEFGIFREKKNAPLQRHPVRTLVDPAFSEERYHN